MAIAVWKIECFWGCKILILLKSDQICPNLITFAQISPQFCQNFDLIQPNLPKSNQIYQKSFFFLGGAAASPAPTALHMANHKTRFDSKLLTTSFKKHEIL